MAKCFKCEKVKTLVEFRLRIKRSLKYKKPCYYYICKPCESKKNKLYWAKNPERRKVYDAKYQTKRKLYWRKQAEELGDIYIKSQLCNNSSLRYGDISTNLLKAKREHLKFIRLIREVKKMNKEVQMQRF